MYRRFFKRAFDVMVSGLALLVLCVPLGIVTLWLHFANKGAGAFFFQERPGKNGRIFRICKFKTMTDERDADGKLLPDAKRITKVGRFVRSTSIDELPQLWNVLKGDMSLIGPRPLLVKYLPYYTEREQLRHSVRPGITGWSQVNGRNQTTWNLKLENDVWYVENLSFRLDVQIVWRSVVSVLRHDGVEVVTSEPDFDDERGNKI